MVATAIIGGAVASAGATVIGASKAASAQKDAAKTASETEQRMYEQTRQDLGPYRDVGQTGINALNANNAYLTNPIVMDQAALEKTPGYQFNLEQGLKATQNSAAARGLGSSGAAMKGASAFATGLADNTYQNQFNNALTNQTNTYNRITGLINTGQNSAAQTGSAAIQTGQSIASNTIGAGNATAAAYMSGASALGSAFGSIPAAMAYNNKLTGMYGA